MTPDGTKINYKAMASDPQFQEYINATAELQTVDLTSLDREEALCFWINIYNALVVHATAAVGPPRTSLQRLSWYSNVSYEISSLIFSLNDMEHGILRGNAPSPASIFNLLGLKQFAAPQFSSPSDPRLPFVLHPIDPRCHFALNCGATSCPPIRVYTPGKLEYGLQAAATMFVSQEVKVVGASTIEMSSILKWYGSDFGTKKELLEFIVDTLRGSSGGNEEVQKKREQLEAMVASVPVESIRFVYTPYDWSVNDVE